MKVMEKNNLKWKWKWIWNPNCKNILKVGMSIWIKRAITLYKHWLSLQLNSSLFRSVFLFVFFLHCSITDPALEKHPERRMKAAYKAFEAIHLPRLKAENPNLRMSQFRQMLKKDWSRSPDNPLNQRTSSYNTKWKQTYIAGDLWSSAPHRADFYEC